MGEKRTIDAPVAIVSLQELYEPEILYKKLQNLQTILVGPPQPGVWDDFYETGAPIGQINPKGDILAGLGRPDNQRPLPLSEVYEGLDLWSVGISVIAPFGRFIETIISYPRSEAKEYVESLQKEHEKRYDRSWEDFKNIYEIEKMGYDLEKSRLEIKRLKKKLEESVETGVPYIF